MLLKDLLFNQKENDRLAMKFGESSITYKELNNYVKCLVEKIAPLNLKLRNIGIFLPNSIQYAVAYFTITCSDAIIVPIQVQLKQLEIISTIEYCEIPLIITNNKYKEILCDFLKEYEGIYILNLDNNRIEILGQPPYGTSKLVLNHGDITEDDVAILLHTSGTTSNPKRVMLTHKNLISNIKSNIQSLKFNSDDKCLISLPMCFGYCNTAQFLTHIYIGALTIIMEELFLPESFFKLVEEEKITNFTGVPTMLLMLLRYKNINKYNISSLKYICFGGGNMPIDKLFQLIKLFPSVGFVQTYGQTEASPRVTCLLPSDSLKKIGSIGKPIPNVNVRIINDNGNDIEEGEIGEIIVSGDNVMKGYYKRKDDTIKTIRGGWLYTGDLAQIDREEYIYLVGRKKNIIICGGINIYPEEIEEVMLSHHMVKEVYVYGEKHGLLGEIPVAVVVLNNGIGTIRESIIKSYCKDKLASYKIPRKIKFEKEIVKTYTGKCKRYREEIKDEWH